MVLSCKAKMDDGFLIENNRRRLETVHGNTLCEFTKV